MPGILHYLRSFRHLAPLPESDGELLQRFRLHRDELAFATLVHRHGPMVLGIARRVLGHSDTTDDVFQATFLVLAKRGRHLVFDEWKSISQQLLDASLALATNHAAKLKAMEEHRNVLKQIEDRVEARYKSGNVVKDDHLAAQLRRIEFEIQIEEMKAKR